MSHVMVHQLDVEKLSGALSSEVKGGRLHLSIFTWVGEGEENTHTETGTRMHAHQQL